MATKREQILGALLVLLRAAPAVCADIERERAREWSIDKTLSINIVPEADPRQETGGNLFTDRGLLVNFQIGARGDAPTTLADPCVDALHTRLMSDRTLGGLAIDIVAGDNEFDWDDADADYCVVGQRYLILYRTQETNLSA